MPRSCVLDHDASWQPALPGRINVCMCAEMTALEQLPRALNSIPLHRPVIRAVGGAGAPGVVEGDEIAPSTKSPSAILVHRSCRDR